MQTVAAPAAAARGGRIPEELHPDVAEALRARGIERLWSHQAEALHAAWAGPTIVTTGTASGKSLCFHLPTLDVLEPRRAGARAVPVPDQGAGAGPGARAARARRRPRARPAIYDGDTPREQRAGDPAAGERRAHQPGHAAPRRSCPTTAAWGDFFSNLAVVVVDEAHVYRGVFGSHVAQRAAAAAARRRRVRHRAAVPAGQRDDRQPGRAGRAADRARRLHGGRRGRLARPPSARSRCGTRRSPTRSSAPAARRWPRRPTCSPSSWPRARARSCS